MKINVVFFIYFFFFWILLPALAFTSYPNAHNGYGDFTHLEEATVGESEDFYATFYSPANAVLAVVGDCAADEVFALAERYFGSIRRRRVPKRGPLARAPAGTDLHRVVRDPLAPQPTFAVGYRTTDPVGDLDRYLVYDVLASAAGGR